MSTYREIQDRICLDYLNRRTLYEETKRAIKNAIKSYEAKRYWFNETATALATVAGASYLSVPSDFMVLDRLEVNYSGTNNSLLPVPFSTVREMNATSATSVPTHYAYRGDRFELALIPDSAYAVNCYYQHTLPALSADDDSNAWTTEAENLIVHTATLDMLISVLHVPDQNRILLHGELKRQAMNELDLRNMVRMQTGLLPTSF